MAVNVISLSGGKDSTALALLAIERNVENIRFVFCNTGNEARETLDYIVYLEQILHSKTGRNIEVCEVSFRKKLVEKSVKVEEEKKKDCARSSSV